MKKLWDKIKSLTDDGFQLFITVFIALIMIGGLVLQSNIYSNHVDRLQEIHKFQTEFYKSEHDKIKASGNTLFEVYSREKANSDLKDQVLEKQQTIIQQLLKQLEEYRKWDNIDPNKIT